MNYYAAMRYLPESQGSCFIQPIAIVYTAPDSGWLYSDPIFIAHTARLLLALASPKVI